MISALGRGNIVDEREHTLPIIPRMLNGELNEDIVLDRLVINGLRIQLSLPLVQALDEIADTAVVFEYHAVGFAFQRKLVQLAEQRLLSLVQAFFRLFVKRFALRFVLLVRFVVRPEQHAVATRLRHTDTLVD